MNIKELFESWVLEWQLLSEADAKNKAGKINSGLANQVIIHLVKIYKYNNPIDLQHHCTDIDNWLYSIKNTILKGNKKPKFENYYQWMATDNELSEELINKISKSLKDYNRNLAQIRSNHQVYNIINNMLYDISRDFANDTFLSIDDYIDKIPPYDTDDIEIDTNEFNYDQKWYDKNGY